MWSALKSHFGSTYKEINSAKFTEALSLVARIPLSEEQLAPPQEPTFPYRWLVSNYFGEVKYQPVPINADVMSTEEFLKALIDDRKPVDNKTLCDFVVAATQRLCQKSANMIVSSHEGDADNSASIISASLRKIFCCF